MTTDEQKWIDDASYEELLKRWRFGALGDDIFTGESGIYYAKSMSDKKGKCDHVRASKNIGWGN